MVANVPFLHARITNDQDFLILKQMVQNQEQWNLEYDKNGIKIWSKVVQNASIKMVKVWSNFPTVSSTDVYNTLMDADYRPHWDPHMQTGFEIGHLNYNNAVTYYAVSCPPPLRSRDFVLQISWLNKGSEQYVLNHSVCHKDHPPRRGYIRAISFFSGYFLKCAPHNSCEMSFVSQTDPQGIVPSWIINKCTQIFAPRFVKQLEKAAFAYRTWKSQNNPTHLPWMVPEQMNTPKIPIADCRPSEEEQQSTFFKYVANVSFLEWWSGELHVSFSSPSVCSEERELPKRIWNSIGESKAEKEHVLKEKKSLSDKSLHGVKRKSGGQQ